MDNIYELTPTQKLKAFRLITELDKRKIQTPELEELAAKCDINFIANKTMKPDDPDTIISKIKHAMTAPGINRDAKVKVIEIVAECIEASPNSDLSKMISFRCDESLRQSFIEKARSKNVTSTSLFTQYMKEYVEGYNNKQIDLSEVFDSYFNRRLSPIEQEIADIKEILANLTKLED